jgi:hypothetical protein
VFDGCFEGVPFQKIVVGERQEWSRCLLWLMSGEMIFTLPVSLSRE